MLAIKYLILPFWLGFVSLIINYFFSNEPIQREIVLSLTLSISANFLSLIKHSPVVRLYSITYANTNISVGFNPIVNKFLSICKKAILISSVYFV